MSDNAGPVQKLWQRLDGQRQSVLQFKRSVARFVDPAILPDRGYQYRPSSDDPSILLPVSYSSVATKGSANLAARLQLQVFPPFAPWFEHQVRPAVWHDPRIPDEMKVKARRKLWLHDLTLQSLIESAPYDQPGRNALSFRASMTQAMMMGVVVGEACIQCLPKMQVRVHSMNNYTVARDDTGGVRCVGLREVVDPLELPEDVRSKLGETYEDEDYDDRCEDMYTREEWHPLSKKWVVTQEIEGVTVHEHEAPFAEFIVAPYTLNAGQPHGTGHCELNYGDIYSLSTLDMHYLRFAASASRFHPAIDPSSGIRIEDLNKPSGTPFVTKVTNGVVDGFAFVQMNKGADFAVVQAVREAKRRDVGQSMLLDSEVAGRGEAFRHASAWQAVINENNMAMGPAFVNFQEHLIMQLVLRMRWQMGEMAKSDKSLAGIILTESDIYASKPALLTGLASLKRQSDKAAFLEYAQVISMLGAQQMVDPEVATEVYARFNNQYNPGLIKSPEKIAQEQRAAVQAQNQMAAGSAAAQALANVAEANLSPQAA